MTERDPAVRLLPSTGRRILDAIKRELDGARNAILTSAYVTSPGLELLLPSITSLLHRGGTLTLYATFDGGPFTDPKFFQLLQPLQQQFVEQLKVYLYPNSNTLFHAKAFLFERADQTWSAIVGSANITHPALAGDNFEISVAADPIAHSEIVMMRDELSRLRANKMFVLLTAKTYADICSARSAGDIAPGADPEETARTQRRAKAHSNQVRLALASAKPMILPPLPELAEPAAVYVESLCSTGTGVATDDDLGDLTVSVDLEFFVKAGVLAKETTKRIGFVSEKTKRGHSFSLIDDTVRSAINGARKSIGKTIGVRAVDFGYLRWVPKRLYSDAFQTIAAKSEVRLAREAVANSNQAISKHLEQVGRSFHSNMEKVVAALPLQPESEWDEDMLEQWGMSAKASIVQIRAQILDHIVGRTRDRVSESLVRSQLARLTFAPRTFAFPLAQSHGADWHYGHKHFLANVVWACTDRVLKRVNEDEGASGELFEYLDARRRLNSGRHGHNTSQLAARAAGWLNPEVTLDAAVAEFRQAYGPEDFSWVHGDLARMLTAASPSQ